MILKGLHIRKTNICNSLILYKELLKLTYKTFGRLNRVSYLYVYE